MVNLKYSLQRKSKINTWCFFFIKFQSNWEPTTKPIRPSSFLSSLYTPRTLHICFISVHFNIYCQGCINCPVFTCGSSSRLTPGHSSLVFNNISILGHNMMSQDHRIWYLPQNGCFSKISKFLLVKKLHLEIIVWGPRVGSVCVFMWLSCPWF